MNTKDKGNISEQRIIVDLLENDMSVSTPVGDNERYDIILDTGNSLLKLQVKTAQVTDNESIKFNCSSSYLLSSGSVERTYSEEEIDAFAVYCPETDDIAYVPINDAPKNKMWLRKERKSSRSNVLEDFGIGAVVE